MSLKLRPLQPDDIQAATHTGMAAWVSGIVPALSDFDCTRIPHIENLFRAFFLAHLQGEAAARDHLIVADLGGQLAGFYNLDCQQADLTDLWVAPQWQGQGIASSLMRDAMQKARSAGRREMHLSVLSANKRAIAFYEKFGFTEVKRWTERDEALNIRVEKLALHSSLDEEP